MSPRPRFSRRLRQLVVPAVVAVLAVSCGSDDDGGAVSDVADTIADVADTIADDVAAADTTVPGDDSEAAPSGGHLTCDAIFSAEEVEEFLAEPAELVEESLEGAGQLTCNWSSMEEEGSTDDLVIQSLQVQYLTGTPVEAATVFDNPSFEPSGTIDGVGDRAFTTEKLGAKAYVFIDGETGGLLMYIGHNLGPDDDGDVLRDDADVEALFRTFHARVS